MRSLIFLNDNIPSHTTMRGVTRYFRHITDGLIERFGERVLVYTSDQRDFGAARCWRAIRFKGTRRLGLHDALASLAAWRVQPALLYCPYFGATRTRAPEIFTIYDTLTEENARAVDPRGWRGWRYVAETRRCLERAAAILAISHSTARDVQTLYPHLPTEKFTVTLLGVDPFFFERPTTSTTSTAERPYILYIGERAGHKNFINALKAFAHSGLAREFDLRVHSRLTAWEADEAAILRQFHLQNRVQLRPPVGEVELRAAYTSAAALVYSSLQEGFGLPILEALASGTLIAASNVSALPEVGGDVAYYFDPREPEAIAATLRQIIALPSADRQARIERGITHARAFTWARCQQQTVRVFQQALGE